MRERILIACLVAGLGLALPVRGQKQTPPEGGTPKDFTLPEKSVFELDNGLSATLVPYGQLPKVAISVIVRTGNIDESANQVWRADVMGDLLKEGTKLRELSITKASPESVTLELFRKLLYPGHPYGRLFPTEEMLKGYTIKDVRDFYARNFGAGRTRVYVCGRFEKPAVEQAILKSFEGWAKGPEPARKIPSPMAKRRVEIIDRPGSEQSTVYLGLPVVAPGHRDYIPLVVANSLLGGSFGSRITSNIREQKGYTYSPYSSVSSRYRDAYWTQFASVSTNVTGPALKEIIFEIDRLQAEAPSEEELRGIQNYLAGTFVLQNSSRSGIISQLAFLDLHGLPDDYLTGYVKAIHSVKPEDVRRIAKTYLRDQEMTLVITGDKSKIAEQVGEFEKAWEKGSD